MLPNYMFKPRCARIKRPTISAARELAGEFSASVTATLIRMVRSNCFPIIVTCHNKAGRRWGWAADMVPGWWKQRIDLDPESYGYGLVFQDAAEEKWPRKIDADAWFDFNGCRRYQVEEQSFRVTGKRF